MNFYTLEDLQEDLIEVPFPLCFHLFGGIFLIRKSYRRDESIKRKFIPKFMRLCAFHTVTSHDISVYCLFVTGKRKNDIG